MGETKKLMSKEVVAWPEFKALIARLGMERETRQATKIGIHLELDMPCKVSIERMVLRVGGSDSELVVVEPGA